MPYNARSNWHIYSSPRQTAEREQLLTLLGKANAIVLCGHLHKYSFLTRRTETGRITQLALCSVASTFDAAVKDQREGLDAYGPELVELEPQYSPATIEDRRATLAAERAFIEHFEYANTWGHGLVTVNDDTIDAHVFRGLERAPWKKLELTRVSGEAIGVRQ